MTSIAIVDSNLQQFPWALLIFLISFVIVELAGFFSKKGKPYSVIIFEHIIKAVFDIASEIFEKEEVGKRLCGIAVTIQILAFIIAVILYGLHSCFTHVDALKPIIICILIAIFAVPAIIGSYELNKRFIS